MLIDFHTHTSASDGALAPEALLRRAQEAGVGQLAITDHDTLAGLRSLNCEYPSAAAAVRLIPGIEFSCCWSGTTVHIVGLDFDVDHEAMQEGVATVQRARVERGRAIAERLAARGFHGALEGALEKAGESQLGRPHFAAWMAACGHVRDEATAFNKFLGQGKTGDVKAFWPRLEAVTRWVTAAGGVAVVAHPLKYRFTRAKLRRLMVDFLAAGGTGIELLSGRQTQQQTARISALAREFSLAVSVGSDFHKDTAYGTPLGVEMPRVDGLRAVWDRWTASADIGEYAAT